MSNVKNFIAANGTILNYLVNVVEQQNMNQTTIYVALLIEIKLCNFGLWQLP